MTSEQKANEIGNKMYNGSIFDYSKDEHLIEKENAKRCALIAIDEILKMKAEFWDDLQSEYFDYWQDVKNEIEKL